MRSSSARGRSFSRRCGFRWSPGAILRRRPGTAPQWRSSTSDSPNDIPPGQNPLGRQLAASIRRQKRNLVVVGLAKNVSATGLRVSPVPIVYVPLAQLPADTAATLEVRAGGDTARVSRDLREAVRTTLPDASVEVRPLVSQVDDTMLQERMLATLTGAFGLLALGLACIGLYGLLAYGVAQRIREIGIRLALGAQRRGVTAMVLKTLCGSSLPVSASACRPRGRRRDRRIAAVRDHAGRSHGDCREHTGTHDRGAPGGLRSGAPRIACRSSHRLTARVTVPRSIAAGAAGRVTCRTH